MLDGALGADGTGCQADTHAHGGHHARAIAAELDDRQQLHGGGIKPLLEGDFAFLAGLGFLAALTSGAIFLLASHLALEALHAHIANPEGFVHFPQDVVGRGITVFEFLDIRGNLGFDEFPQGIPQHQMLFVPFDHICEETDSGRFLQCCEIC